MGVSLEEVLTASGYNIRDNVEDAEWLLEQKSDFDELLEKALDLTDEHERYQWYVQELEDSGDYGHVVPFEEWRETCKK